MENLASAPKSVNICTTGSQYMYTMKYITKLYDTFRTDDDVTYIPSQIGYLKREIDPWCWQQNN